MKVGAEERQPEVTQERRKTEGYKWKHLHEKLHFKESYIRDFHGGPTADTSPSEAVEGVCV